MKAAILFLSILFTLSCKSKSQNYGILTITEAVDSCYYLRDLNGNTINVSRKMEIIENTFTDSVGVGFGLVPKGYVGTILYTRLSERRDEAIDPEIEFEYWPKTNMICLDLYLNRVPRGKITIRYQY